MPDRIDVDEIISRNPQVDREQLEKAGEMARNLRDMGVHRKGYNIASPFGRRRIAVPQDDAQTDRRAIRLKRPRDVR